MPITQDRMLRLIDSATSMLESYEQILRRIVSQRNLIAEDQRIGKEIDALGEFDGLVEAIRLMGPSTRLVTTIAEERAHFNVRKNRNARARDYQAIRRGKEIEPAEPVEIDASTDVKPSYSLHQRLFSFQQKAKELGLDETVAQNNILDIIEQENPGRDLDIVLTDLMQLGVVQKQGKSYVVMEITTGE